MAACAISFFIICLSSFSLTEAQKGGFSLELIHRDSPKSPFFNPNETPFDRIINSLRRSINHVKLIDPNFASPASAQADIIPNDGEYLMKISIGTPPVEILAVADTGSDLIWTQCQPCILCYKQEAPLFNPFKSSTYKDLPCMFSKQCASMRSTSCSVLGAGKCEYSVSYGDKSYSNGNLAIDTVTLGSVSGRPVVLPNTIIGCGHNNGGTFSSKTAGIVGLGGGNVSLVSQMGPSLGGKFSYCLVPLFSSDAEKSTKMNFGTIGVVSGSGVVSTPLVSKNPTTFYFLTLEAISVGNQRVEVDRSSSSTGTKEGNIIIDSGTTLTLLPQVFNSKLVSAVSSLMKATPVQDPKGLLDLCYNVSSDLMLPEITVHFTGADVKLTPLNTFVRVSRELVCLTFKGFDQGTAIYGNLMQMNFLVGYDTEKRTVSFKPTDCNMQ